jgi:hypothetical protein
MRWRTEWNWTLAALTLVLLGFWWFIGGSQRTDDTYSASPRGKKAFFLLTGELQEDVERNTDLLVPHLDRYGTICLLGPARYPTSQEWRILHEWVRSGGRFVFAARFDEPDVDLSPFPISVSERTPASGLPIDSDEALPIGERRLDTNLAPGDFDWESDATIEATRPITDLASIHSDVQVARLRVGRGTIVVVASDRIFTNAALASAAHDNGRLAYRIFTSSSPVAPVAFDESLNSSGTPKVFAVLFDTESRRVTLQVLLCALLFAWWGSRRFGPSASVDRVRRRSVVEHAVALGNLHYKSGSGSRLVAAYLERLRVDLAPGEHAASIARRAGLDPFAVESTLARAQAAAEEESTHPAVASAIVRALAEIRRELHQSKGDRHGA